MNPGGWDLVDLHSHLVPGVDDGAQNLDSSLKAVSQFLDAGVGRIVTTPHFSGSLVLRPAALEHRLREIQEGWRLLKESVDEMFPGVDLRLGLEIMMEDPLLDLTDSRLSLAEGHFVLIEWPRMQVPPGTGAVVERLAGQGLVPVIAHPERYHGLDRDLKIPEEWRAKGAVLQVNHGALLGQYGVEAQGVATRLLRKGMVDVLASDFHPRKGNTPLVERTRDLFLEMGAEEQWRTLACTNPGRIVDGQRPLPVTPVSAPMGLWSRVREALGRVS